MNRNCLTIRQLVLEKFSRFTPSVIQTNFCMLFKNLLKWTILISPKQSTLASPDPLRSSSKTSTRSMQVFVNSSKPQATADVASGWKRVKKSSSRPKRMRRSFSTKSPLVTTRLVPRFLLVPTVRDLDSSTSLFLCSVGFLFRNVSKVRRNLTSKFSPRTTNSVCLLWQNRRTSQEFSGFLVRPWKSPRNSVCTHTTSVSMPMASMCVSRPPVHSPATSSV